MGYTFDGCFSRDAPSLSDAMSARWPYARVRAIDKPFRGIGLRLPWEIPDETTQELVYRFRDELRDWSRSFPELAFAYVRAECFGGHCEYEGYVCRNGAILFEEELDSKALGRLMALIGVKLPAGDYFEPFTRKYEW